jgi:protein-arginine kinase activator protein McsA
MNQENLLKIVQTWHIKNKPEFRGFTCGNCGRILRRAWHHWLNIGSFKTPVHLCNRCQRRLNIKSKKTKIDKSKIGNVLSGKIKAVKRIIDNWKVKAKPTHKVFSCDICGKNIYKAYHIWLNLDNTLSEIHLCRKCEKSLK